MSLLVADCPRCGSERMTFDVRAQTTIARMHTHQFQFEAYCECRVCHLPTVFQLMQMNDDVRWDPNVTPNALVNSKAGLNGNFLIEGYVSEKDKASKPPPEHLPPQIEAVLHEGAACLAINCFNAAGCMFRKCVDLATKPLLPAEGAEKGPSHRERRDLGLRLPWLFANGDLPERLHDLANCIKEDGNEAAHSGDVTMDEAEEMLDFTERLLVSLYTEPREIGLAKERQAERKAARKQ